MSSKQFTSAIVVMDVLILAALLVMLIQHDVPLVYALTFAFQGVAGANLCVAIFQLTR